MALSEADKSTVAALYAAFVPDAAPPGGPEGMCAALDRLPAHRLAEIRSFLALTRTPLFGVLTGGAPRSLSSMNAGARECALLRLRDSPVPKLRTAYQAFKRLALFVAYSYGGRTNQLWSAVAYPGPDPGAPDPCELRLLEPAALKEHYDVIVIGSGAGGGVAAALSAKAGASVLVLEAGPSARTFARAQQEFDAFANLYLDSGLTSTEDLGCAILAGSCVGGGTTVNWSTSLRLHGKVAAQWARAAGGIDFDDSLAPHYGAVSERLQLTTSFRHNRNNAVLQRAAERLDWSGGAHPRNARGCGSECGYCGFGCAYGRKASTPRTYLADAVALGAHVVAGARVERLHATGSRVRAVNVVLDDGQESMRRTITADRVVAAAGSLRTPGLLSSAGVRHASLGAHLRLHPTTALIAEFEEPVEPWNGPIQSYLIDEFSDLDDGYGVKLEAVPAHPGLAALALPWEGREKHAAEMRLLYRSAALIVLTRDRGSGFLSADGTPRIHYRLDPYDAAHMRTGMCKLAQGALSAGATRVRTLHNAPVEVRNARELYDFSMAIAAAPGGANRLGLFSAHQMGTARMHADPAQGVLDGTGRVHGFENLFVCDASVFPLASGVNPMLTIMAIAHRTTSEALREG